MPLVLVDCNAKVYCNTVSNPSPDEFCVNVEQNCFNVENCGPNSFTTVTKYRGDPIIHPCRCVDGNAITCDGKATSSETDHDYLSLYSIRNILGNGAEYIIADDINKLRRFINAQESAKNVASWYYGSIPQTNFGSNLNQGDKITSRDFLALKNAINNLITKLKSKNTGESSKVASLGFSDSNGNANFAVGDIIYASHFNLLAKNLDTVARACICNTKYTCSCDDFVAGWTEQCPKNGAYTERVCSNQDTSRITCSKVYEMWTNPVPVPDPTPITPTPPTPIPSRKETSFSKLNIYDIFLWDAGYAPLAANDLPWDVGIAQTPSTRTKSYTFDTGITTAGNGTWKFTKIKCYAILYSCHYYDEGKWATGSYGRVINWMKNSSNTNTNQFKGSFPTGNELAIKIYMGTLKGKYNMILDASKSSNYVKDTNTGMDKESNTTSNIGDFFSAHANMTGHNYDGIDNMFNSSRALYNLPQYNYGSYFNVYDERNLILKNYHGLDTSNRIYNPPEYNSSVLPSSVQNYNGNGWGNGGKEYLTRLVPDTFKKITTGRRAAEELSRNITYDANIREKILETGNRDSVKFKYRCVWVTDVETNVPDEPYAVLVYNDKINTSIRTSSNSSNGSQNPNNIYVDVTFPNLQLYRGNYPKGKVSGNNIEYSSGKPVAQFEVLLRLAIGLSGSYTV